MAKLSKQQILDLAHSAAKYEFGDHGLFGINGPDGLFDNLEKIKSTKDVQAFVETFAAEMRVLLYKMWKESV
ncbi:MAG: hypothetical protein ACWGQW_03205 [bacterium]